MRGLYYPLRFGRTGRGLCSIRVRIPYLTVIAIANTMGWLLSNLHIVQTRTYIHIRPFCFLDAYPKLMVLSRTPLQLLYTWLLFNQTRHRNQQACYHWSPINTIYSSARSIHQRLRHTDSEQIPHRTHTHRSSKARSPTACYIHCNEITIHT